MIREEEINIIVEAFIKNSNFDFSNYSLRSLTRRLDKVLISNKISADQLAFKISVDNKFLIKIKNEITVNTTELFRDSDIWLSINDKLIPKLKELDEIKIWHAGCSSGEEVYSMMILLDSHGLLDKTTIIASDLNDLIIETAKKAEYKNNIIADYIDNFNLVFDSISTIKPDINSYFDIDKKTNILKLKKDFRNKVKFINHDLVNNEPNIEENFDVVFCRNVLIYFNMNLQNNIIKNFYSKLNQGGSIVLGAHECILNPFESKFNKENTIYIKKF